MNPRLIVINGPQLGKVIALTEDEISLGREAANTICLSDLAVSRRHCLIRRERDQFTVRDLGSFNGTMLNGVLVQEQPLEHRDQISVGDTLFLFLLSEDDQSQVLPGLVEFEEHVPVQCSTIKLLREDAVYLSPARVRKALPHDERTGHDLNTLLKINMIANSVRNLKQLQQELLQLILEAIPAQRGAILLTGASPQDVISITGRERLSKGEQLIKVSRTIVDHVLREGASILGNEILTSPAFGDAESLVGSQTRSVLCAPLVYFGNVIGVIYLSSSEVVKFDEAHLQLLTGVAGIAAVSLENALHVEWVENENLQLQTELKLTHQMLGNSTPMLKIYHFITQLAPTNSTVLIRGESGTGKELAAHAIHLNSSRADKAFVAINCAAFPDALFESELFGHEKGAFSGAGAQKKGLLEMADGGTLFLDEVGELPASAQAKLLRVLETGEFRRLGNTKEIRVDIRIVAATNRNLEREIADKTFRDDLYHRLNVLSFEMPPLTERGDDILLLTRHLILKFNQKHNRSIIGISPKARERLMKYAWPGNVRELSNTIERAVLMERTRLLTTEFLPAGMPEKQPSNEERSLNIHASTREAQKTAITEAYQQSNGNYTSAAAILGIHPNHLHRLIRTLNLKATLVRSKNRNAW